MLPSLRCISGALPPPAIELPDVHRRLLPLALERLADAWKNDHEVWFVSRARMEACAPHNELAAVDGLSELAHQIAESAGAWGDEFAVAATPHAQVAVASGTATAAVLAPRLSPVW